MWRPMVEDVVEQPDLRPLGGVAGGSVLLKDIGPSLGHPSIQGFTTFFNIGPVGLLNLPVDAERFFSSAGPLKLLYACLMW